MHCIITAVIILNEKLFSCSYPDMFTEKSCSMCPDKWISTLYLNSVSNILEPIQKINYIYIELK